LTEKVAIKKAWWRKKATFASTPLLGVQNGNLKLRKGGQDIRNRNKNCPAKHS